MMTVQRDGDQRETTQREIEGHETAKNTTQPKLCVIFLLDFPGSNFGSRGIANLCLHN
jgi:hypothetical protein